MSISKKEKLYDGTQLAEWRADANAGEARTRLTTRTKTYNRYVAVLDGVLVGWFIAYLGDRPDARADSGGRLHLAYAAKYKRAVARQHALIAAEVARSKARSIVAVLDVQWGGNRAERWFQINPYNHSGKRLIKLVGHDDFVVTNACPQCVENANGRGTPDAAWLADNLRALKPRVVLVCGNVAQATFAPGMVPKGAKVFKLPHPAARTWTKAEIASWSKRIQKHTT